MKKIFLLFTFCCGTFLIFSQNKEKETIRKFNEVIDAAIKTKDIGLMDDYLVRNPIDTTNLIAFFLSGKAYVLAKIHKDELRNYKKGNQETGKKIATIMKLYKESIDTCEECALKYTANRVGFLERIGNEDSDIYKSDIKKLKAAGYKQDRQGIDLFVQYARGKNNWIGGGISFMKFQAPFYFLKRINPKTGKKELVYWQIPSAGSFFSFAYKYDWTNRTNDMSFSLFQIEAPLYINLTKFGMLENAKFKKRLLYYRPEIGFGTGNIGLYYGFNIKLKKSNPAEINKHLITLKVSRIFNKKS